MTPQNRIQKMIKKWTVSQIDDRDRDEIGNPLQDIGGNQLHNELRELAATLTALSHDDMPKLEQAAQAAKEAKDFYHAARQVQQSEPGPLNLTMEEAASLVAERETMLSQRGMVAVICTIATAAFLQGHVQSSINAASLYAGRLHLSGTDEEGIWQLGAMNAAPFLTAALVGAPLSLPTNYYIGRRGALLVSAVLIVASSLGQASSHTWQQVLGTRIVGGVGMGIKAVSAPILASETAVGFWRGSTIVTWQLWVACGIMTGFVMNLIIVAATGALATPAAATDGSDVVKQVWALRWILGAPAIFGVALLVVVFFCYESPRFYLREKTPSYNPNRALEVLLKLRETKLQAFRDLILVLWSTKPQVDDADSVRFAPGDDMRSSVSSDAAAHTPDHPGLTYASQLRQVLRLSLDQYKTPFTTPRLRNAVWSTCTVALAQQLCGINVFAFYSNTLFIGAEQYPPSHVMAGNSIRLAMIYSFLFGLVNFVFCIPAMRSIDTMGRRQWLLYTLPVMALCLMAAAAASPDKWDETSGRKIVGIVFIFIFAAAYSPGLGPVPFTLASESFPLSHREAGTSVAISINLFFAGLLTLLLPRMNKVLTPRGLLGLFSGLNLVAFSLVFFLVEETRRVSLEDLDEVFKNPKKKFVLGQLESIGIRRSA